MVCRGGTLRESLARFRSGKPTFTSEATGVRFAARMQMLRIQDALLGAGGFGLLVAALAAINSDVRRHVVTLVAGDVTELTIIAAPIDRAARVAFRALNDYQTDNGLLFAFGVAAVVLFGFLFKA